MKKRRLNGTSRREAAARTLTIVGLEQHSEGSIITTISGQLHVIHFHTAGKSILADFIRKKRCGSLAWLLIIVLSQEDCVVTYFKSSWNFGLPRVHVCTQVYLRNVDPGLVQS